MGEGRLRQDLFVAAIAAALGFGAVFAIPNRAGESNHESADSSLSQTRAGSESHRHSAAEPKSPALAALGGRTKPARGKFAELWALGDASEEAIDLAVALMCADPAWFAEFSRTHEESDIRRLLDGALPCLAKVHPESFWRLLGDFENVRDYWSSADFGARRNETFAAVVGASNAAIDFVIAHWDVLEDRPKARAFLHGVNDPAQAQRLLQQWWQKEGKSGIDDVPYYVTSALRTLQMHEGSVFEDVRDRLSDEVRAMVDTELRIRYRIGEEGKVPPLGVEELAGLSNEQVGKLLGQQAKAGVVPSVEALTAVEPQKRGHAAVEALGECYRWMGRVDVERFLEESSRLELNEADRVMLEAEAAKGDWMWCSDINGALARLDGLPDNDVTRSARESIIEEWIYVDPLAVTRYAEALPPGEFREDLLARAREATP